MSVSSALENGAPRNLGALAAAATRRGWGAMVERVEARDEWTLIVATPSDSRTGRHVWRAGKWVTFNTHGYRETVAFYRTGTDGAPRANTPAETPAAAADVVADPVADAQEHADAEAAEAFRVKATRAHDRVTKGHKRVVAAAERAGIAWERAEAAHARANVAEEQETERAHARIAEADALMWSHRPGSSEYHAAFGEFLTARFDAESMPAAEAAAEAAEYAERARKASADAWEDADGAEHTGAGAALETADHARKEVMIEYGAFERSTPASRFEADTACDIVCGHARDMAAAVRHAEAAADAAEAAADQAESWADAAEEEADTQTFEADGLFTLGTADRRQVALARAYWGVSDAVADAYAEAAADGSAEEERRAAVRAAEAATAAEREAARPAERAEAQRAAERVAAAEEAETHSARAAEAYAITRDLMTYTLSAWAARPVDNLPEAEAAEARAFLRLLDRRSRTAHTVDFAARWDWYDGARVTDPQRARDCANRARVLADGCEADARRVAELFAWTEHAQREAAAEEERRAAVRWAEEELARAEERARNQSGYPSAQARRIGEGNARRAVQNARCALAELNGRPFVARAEISGAGHDRSWYVVDASRGRRIVASGFGCMAEAERDAERRNDERAAEAAEAAAVARKAQRRVEEAEERAAEARRRAERLDAAAGVHYGRFAGGQPILMRHGSARGALRDRARGDAATRRAIEATAEADRAEGAARKARQAAELAETVAGRARPWERADFRRGDVVEVRKIYTDTYVVVRANAKTLTLRNANTIDDVKARYDQVLSRTRAGETLKDPGLSRELDEDTSSEDTPRGGEGGFTRGLDADASTATVPARPADVISDPGTVDAWEGEGGAVPGVEAPAARREPARTSAILADGDAEHAWDRWGKWSEHGEWLGWTCADCTTCAGEAKCAECADCTEFAAPCPPRWARDWQKGEPERCVEIFGGPGGMQEARRLMMAGWDVVAIEWDEGAAATARAAGHTVIVADVRTLDPRHPAFRDTRRFHGSPPCPTFSTGGKLAGLNPTEIMRLMDLFNQAGEAFGWLMVDDVCSVFGGPHDYWGNVLEGKEDDPHADTYDGPECIGGLLPPCMTPDEFREAAREIVSDERTALMAEMLIWPLVLMKHGAPLQSVTMEQSNNLLLKAAPLCEAIQEELRCAGFDYKGFDWVSFQIADAVDQGAASHRVRTWMVATRDGNPWGASYDYARENEWKVSTQLDDCRKCEGCTDGERCVTPVARFVKNPAGWGPEGHVSVDFLQDRPALPLVTMSAALGINPASTINTRGKRKVDPLTGWVKGGGSFRAGADASQCITGTWYGATIEDPDQPAHVPARRLRQDELAVLVGFRAGYPWQHVGRGAGIRNKSQQCADAVSPFAGMAVTAAVTGRDWYEVAKAYRARLYRLDEATGEPLAYVVERDTYPEPVTRRAIEPGPVRLALPAPPALVAVVPRPRPAVEEVAPAALVEGTARAAAWGMVPAVVRVMRTAAARVLRAVAPGQGASGTAAEGAAPAVAGPVRRALSRRPQTRGLGGVRAGHSPRQGATRQGTRQGARQPAGEAFGGRGPPYRAGPARPGSAQGQSQNLTGAHQERDILPRGDPAALPRNRRRLAPVDTPRTPPRRRPDVGRCRHDRPHTRAPHA
ncbi:DUF3560 domain-containing protein [Streptomyces sp. SID7760]|nr:DUF3560 domain-containing protein [Streptomyces sp. SID7760]